YISNLPAGWHYVEITDQNACTRIDSVLLTEPSELIASLPDSIWLNCFGDSNGASSVTVTGGSPGYTVSWINQSGNTVGNGFVIQWLAAGTYYALVSDSHSCAATDSIVIAQPDQLILALDAISPLCHNGNDGTAFADVHGGIAPYQYLWNPVQPDNDTINNLTAGIYALTITDFNNCTLTGSVSLTNPPQIHYETTATPVDCSAHMGSALINVNGGIPPYQYLWSNGTQSHIATNLPGGVYSVIASDSHGCQVYDTLEIEIIGSVSAIITQLNQIRCYGDFTAVLEAASNGHSPFEYNWSYQNFTNPVIDNLPAGTYSLSVTDAWGCSGSANYTISEPGAIVADFIVTDALCKYQSNGSAQVIVSGGTPGYDLFWSHNGSTANVVGSLTAGTYHVQITDRNDCVLNASVQVEEPDSVVSASVITRDISCYMSNDGEARALGLGGTPPYVYQWEGPGGYILNQSFTSDNLIPGVYILRIYDAHQCFHSQEVIIFEPEPIYVGIAASSGPSCHGHTDGYIVLDDIQGGTPPYDIFISNGINAWEQQLTEIDSIPAGLYRIDVVDSHHCHHEGEALTVELNESYVDCLQVPAAFSPNGDGFNDTWQISNIYMFPKILIQVYNRWGQLMWEAGSNDPPWDGTYNGTPVPVAPYMYYIDLNNNSTPYYGTVTIIR
ncbi:MAG: gliding motility-associated C-terminal domain-containing protein, partial [Bacteroidales bacterium]|nr:gliding motility-associated C-terminal domain-containing protein [Bacteroidales bacterium]